AEIVGDDVCPGTDAGARHRRRERLGIRKWMAPRTLTSWGREVGVDVEEDGARDVRLAVRRASLVLLDQRPAHVRDADIRVAHMTREPFTRDQEWGAHGAGR